MKKLSLFIFIDALGWEVFQNHPNFLKGIVKDSKRLKTIFGYSSACDPSIISGKLPSEHRMWSSFYYSPQTCPYYWVKHLQWLPNKVTDYHRVRSQLSRLIAGCHGFTGYFQIYNIPFKYLPYFDYMEKKWIWGTQRTLPVGTTIFDDLIAQKTPFYVKESQYVTDDEQWKAATQAAEKGTISFAYLMLGKLDAVMHKYGTHHQKVEDTLKEYDAMIRALLSRCSSKYDAVDWYVFSDHGMHNVCEGYDLQREINSLPIVYGKDYVALYDSTMARFWYLNEKGREHILKKLHTIQEGQVLSDKQLKEFGTFFPDRLYGETIFLMRSPILISPSFMGKQVIPGMHGFHPDDPDSSAMIASNKLLPENLEQIHHIYSLFK